MPKIVKSAFIVIDEILDNFGPSKLDNLKPFFCYIEQYLLGSDTRLKISAMNTCKNVIKWMGSSIITVFTKIN